MDSLGEFDGGQNALEIQDGPVDGGTDTPEIAAVREEFIRGIGLKSEGPC